MQSFRGMRVRPSDQGLTAEVVHLSDADLDEGDVTVAVDYSTVNYKDGLAITGRGGIAKRLPIVHGIDFAGTVLHSSHPRFQPGERVVRGRTLVDVNA